MINMYDSRMSETIEKYACYRVRGEGNMRMRAEERGKTRKNNKKETGGLMPWCTSGSNNT